MTDGTWQTAHGEWLVTLSFAMCHLPCPLDRCGLPAPTLGRPRRPSRGDVAGDLAEAVQAAPQGGGQRVEPLRLDGVLDLVIEPATLETALQDGHREGAAPGADDG